MSRQIGASLPQGRRAKTQRYYRRSAMLLTGTPSSHFKRNSCAHGRCKVVPVAPSATMDTMPPLSCCIAGCQWQCSMPLEPRILKNAHTSHLASRAWLGSISVHGVTAEGQLGRQFQQFAARLSTPQLTCRLVTRKMV